MTREDIVNYLDYLFPNPKCELEYSKDYELLLSVMLSAQTTDKSVNKVTKELYSKYNTLEKLSSLSIEDISFYIRSIGLYKNKARNFYLIVKELCKIGYVPNDRKYLESLPGVGRKTASCVLGILFDEPSFAVDTHVFRLSKRFGISNSRDDVVRCEKKLKKYFKKDEWNKVNSQMVLFGRYYCKSVNPFCENCKLNDICRKSRK